VSALFRPKVFPSRSREDSSKQEFHGDRAVAALLR
jgi:hypothetical protein